MSKRPSVGKNVLNRDTIAQPGNDFTRRTFVKTSGGILVASTLGSSCEGGTNPVITGFVHAIVSGLDPTAADGGIVIVPIANVPGFTDVTILLPKSGDSGIVADIPVGDYSLNYSPPTNHALASGEVNPKTAVVVPAADNGDPTPITWTVIAAQSTVRVVVTGIGASAANGGSASVLRTDLPNQSPVPLPVPVGGTANLGVLVGTYQVTYTPPANHTIGNGVTNPQTVNAVAGAVGTATFDVSSSVQFPVPNIVNNASFETGFDGWTNGNLGNPGGVTRDNTQSFHGSFAVKKDLPRSVFNITSIAVGNPTVVTAPGANIPSTDVTILGSNSTPSINGFRTVTRIDNDRFSVPVNVTGAGTTGTVGRDLGSDLDYLFYAPTKGGLTVDRLWVRFYFYLANAIDGGMKFSRYFDAGFNQQFSGLGLTGTNFSGRVGITFRISPEVDTLSPTDILLVPLASIVAGWHSIEVDYWRNGDTSNGGNDYPSAAFWLDNVPITSQLGALPPGFVFINGRMNAGRRTSSAKIGVIELQGLMNGAPGNTVVSAIWVDRVSVSSVGRIGP